MTPTTATTSTTKLRRDPGLPHRMRQRDLAQRRLGNLTLAIGAVSLAATGAVAAALPGSGSAASSGVASSGSTATLGTTSSSGSTSSSGATSSQQSTTPTQLQAGQGRAAATSGGS